MENDPITVVYIHFHQSDIDATQRVANDTRLKLLHIEITEPTKLKITKQNKHTNCIFATDITNIQLAMSQSEHCHPIIWFIQYTKP